MFRFISAVLVTALLLLFPTTTIAQDSSAAAGFVSSDKYISFAVNIPKNEDDSLYFTLQGTDASWIAVGMGSDKMANTLIFMAYADSTGKNVTVSPRLSYDEVEPVYTSNVTLQVLAGSGIVNGTIKVNAKCGNCRSWKGGSINPEDKAAAFIYASGPGRTLKSNSLSADTKRHSSYGSFVMDLTRAVGDPNIPDEVTSNSPGSLETSNKTDRDYSGAFHAVLMIGTFVGLFPVGIIVLRVLKSPKWHGVLQSISMIVAIGGAGIGVWMGLKYNRSKNYNSAHQIIGTFTILAMIGQFVLGFLHHRMYKKTGATTKLAPIHIWLGRFVITLGVVTGFLGFPLALNPKYDLALLSVVLFMFVILGPAVFWRWRRNTKKQKLAASGSGSGTDTGYQSQPWLNQDSSRSDIQLGRMNYPAPPQYHNQPAAEGRTFV